MDDVPQNSWPTEEVIKRRGLHPLTEVSHAIFLSYASQDAEAAQRICTALRAVGIEVWFDKSELRGGDAWDQKIRRELQNCALFIPVISASTAARHEGYFRLEWDTADRRTRMIAPNRAFIVPVCVDATPEAGADTPESFQRVQWTRLPAGETPPAFVGRIQRLLSGELVSTQELAGPARGATQGDARASRGRMRRGRSLWYGVAAAALLLALGYFGFAAIATERSSAHRAQPPSLCCLSRMRAEKRASNTSRMGFQKI